MANELNDRHYATEGGLNRIVKAIEEGGRGTDYNALSNKPKVNGVELSGDKSAKDLKLSFDVAGQIDYWHTEHDSTNKRYFYNALKDVLVTTGSAYATLVESVFEDATDEKDIVVPYKTGEVLFLISADTTADDIFVGFNYQKGTKVRVYKETVSGSEYFRIEETLIGTGESKPYLSCKRLGAYLYEVTFDSIPESTNLDNALVGGCSAFVKDGKLYRNLDFKYDNTAEFRVKTKDFEGMSFISGMNDGTLDDEKIGQLPYCVNDGCNNDGIRVTTHVLFNDWSYAGAGSKNKLLTELPYFILSNLHSMDDINTVLSSYLANIKVNDSLVSAGYLLQFLVTDGVTTYAILPPTSASGSYVLADATANPKMTNFRWVEDKTVERTSLQNRPTGVERFNLIDNLTDGLKELRFTKAYESTERLSEFIGESGTTKDSTDAQLEVVYNTAHAKYLTRTRNGELWQTVHSVVYGAKGMESLCVQEDWDKDYIPQKAKERPALRDVVDVYDNAPAPVDDQPGELSGVYVFKDSPDLFALMELGAYKDYNVNFTSNSVSYTKMYCDSYPALYYGDTAVIGYSPSWENEAYKTVNFGSKQTVDSKCDAWIKANAVKQEPLVTKTDIVHHSTDSMIVGDLIKVLKDETHEDKMTYYRWDGTEFIFDREEDIVSVWEKGAGENSAQTVGTDCQAQGNSSVAEGFLSMTLNDPSGAIEDWNEGKGAHAEGGGTTAAGNFSHTEGNGTVANNPYEHAEGHFNISNFDTAVYPNKKNTIHSVGIGSNLSNRKNAEEIMQNGDKFLIGVGGYDGTNPYTSHTAQEAINLQHGTEFPTENLYDGMKFLLDEDIDTSDSTGELSGVYVWRIGNDIPISETFTSPPTEFNVNFTSMSNAYAKIEMYGVTMSYILTTGGSNKAYEEYDIGWENQGYRTVDFGSKQTGIDTTFWNFFQANATKQGSGKKYSKGIYHYSQADADWILDADVSEPMLHGTEFPTEPKKDQYFVLDEDIEGGGSADPEGKVSGVYQWNENLEDTVMLFPFVCEQTVNFKDANENEYSMIAFDSVWNMEYVFAAWNRAWSNNNPPVWHNEAYKTIDFGEELQNVDMDFWTAFQASAVKQGGKSYQKGLYRYDSTLEDWVKVANWVDVDIPIVNLTWSSGLTTVMDRRKQYVFSNAIAGACSFNFNIESDVVNEFLLYFTTGATAPSDVSFSQTGYIVTGVPALQANKRYELDFKVNGTYIDCISKEF